MGHEYLPFHLPHNVNHHIPEVPTNAQYPAPDAGSLGGPRCKGSSMLKGGAAAHAFSEGDTHFLVHDTHLHMKTREIRIIRHPRALSPNSPRQKEDDRMTKTQMALVFLYLLYLHA